MRETGSEERTAVIWDQLRVVTARLDAARAKRRKLRAALRALTDDGMPAAVRVVLEASAPRSVSEIRLALIDGGRLPSTTDADRVQRQRVQLHQVLCRNPLIFKQRGGKWGLR